MGQSTFGKQNNTMKSNLAHIIFCTSSSLKLGLFHEGSIKTLLHLTLAPCLTPSLDPSGAVSDWLFFFFSLCLLPLSCFLYWDRVPYTHSRQGSSVLKLGSGTDTALKKDLQKEYKGMERKMLAVTWAEHNGLGCFLCSLSQVFLPMLWASAFII